MSIISSFVLIINFLLCATIFAFGLIIYKKTKTKAALYIGIAFALFGASHFIANFKDTKDFLFTLVGLSTTAYIFVLVGLLKLNHK
jgi:hypothetical protein